jgi:hypothetical protein
MRLAIITIVCLIAGLWSYACYITAADTGPHHPHTEDWPNKVWIDPHRTLIGCQHCRATRVYYDGVLVRDWGNWTAEEIQAASPIPSTAPTAGTDNPAHTSLSESAHKTP